MRYARRPCRLAAALVDLTASVPSAGTGQIHQLAELNTRQINALDKDRTIVLIPGGILEQHGPYLPNFTDGYRNEATTAARARAVTTRPAWTAVIFPTIPLGVGGANELGERYSFPGTYAVRSSTLRAVFVDIASDLGDQGFKWIFIIHLHGAANHNRALDEAGDYFRDTYGGRMVHLYGLMPVLGAGPELASDSLAAAANGFDVHAGRTETSAMLHMRPDLVGPGYRTAAPRPGTNFADLIRIARDPAWPGYFGAPSQATAEEGAERLRHRSDAAAEYMWRIVDGADERSIPRFSTSMLQATPGVVDAALAHERMREDRFAAWLAATGRR